MLMCPSNKRRADENSQENSLKYRGKFLKTLKMQVVPEVGNSHT